MELVSLEQFEDGGLLTSGLKFCCMRMMSWWFMEECIEETGGKADANICTDGDFGPKQSR